MVLLDCAEKALLGDLYLLGLAQGLEEALVASGYGPVVNATRDTLQRLAVARRIDGVVLAIGAERESLARELAERGLPCVVVAQQSIEEIPGVGSVFLDLETGARQVGRLLAAHGHRRIGFIGNFQEDVVLSAFQSELSASGITLARERTVIAGKGRDAGAQAMRELLSHQDPPTAIFARTDLLAAGAHEAAREFRLRVPQEISLVGHDDIPIAESLGLTTVRIDTMELGRAAAEVLTALRQDPSARPPAPVIRTRVIERQSVGPPPK